MKFLNNKYMHITLYYKIKITSNLTLEVQTILSKKNTLCPNDEKHRKEKNSLQTITQKIKIKQHQLHTETVVKPN